MIHAYNEDGNIGFDISYAEEITAMEVEDAGVQIRVENMDEAQARELAGELLRVAPAQQREITFVGILEDDSRRAFDYRITVYGTETTRPDDLDIEEAIKAAADEYLRTKEGKAYLKDTGYCFNYGDAFDTIPDEITRKHGYVVREGHSRNVVVVDLHEGLVPGDIEVDES